MKKLSYYNKQKKEYDLDEYFSHPDELDLVNIFEGNTKKPRALELGFKPKNTRGRTKHKEELDKPSQKLIEQLTELGGE